SAGRRGWWVGRGTPGTIAGPGWLASVAGAADIAGADGTAGTEPGCNSGTAPSLPGDAAPSATVAEVVSAGGTCICSRLQAMNSRVATTSQAQSRKVRVWSIDRYCRSQPGIVPVGSGSGNAPARCSSASKDARKAALESWRAGARATTT